MSIDQANVVDFIGIEGSSVVLTISDHLGWDDEDEHLLALQEKINAYLRFVESGEILDTYPQAAGKTPVINVVMHVPPSPGGSEFLDRIRSILTDAGFKLRARVLDQGSG
jgi:hypothetical protein